MLDAIRVKGSGTAIKPSLVVERPTKICPPQIFVIPQNMFVTNNGARTTYLSVTNNNSFKRGQIQVLDVYALFK